MKYKQGDLIRMTDTHEGGAWGHRDQIGIVLKDCISSSSTVRVRLLARREGNNNHCDSERGIGVYNNWVKPLDE